MSKYIETKEKAQENLIKTYEDYYSAESELAKEFNEIKLIFCIFQYEICSDIASIKSTNPSGFAEKVALKSLIHKIFEFKKSRGHLYERVFSLALEKKYHVTKAEMRHKKMAWTTEINKIDSWAVLRKKATGHYDKDTKILIELIDQIDKDAVIEIAIALILYNQEDLKLMKTIGEFSGA